MSQSSVITSAGKRGRAWTCKLCPFKGERHYVLRHIYSKHLTFDEYPYVCPVCEYRHYDYSNFSKHVQWYYLHAALKGENSLPMPTSSDMSESSRIALGMLDQMSVVDSLQHWQRQRRMRTSQPIQRQTPSCVWPILPAPVIAAAHDSEPSPVTVCADSCPSATDVLHQSPSAISPPVPVSNPVPHPTDIPPSSAPVPSSSSVPVSASSSTTLQHDEVAVLSEFLVFEDTSEFDQEPSTREVGTNTSPRKESDSEVRKLQDITASQERALRNNTKVIQNLQRMLQEQKSNDGTSCSVHNGPGEGERPKITSRRKLPAVPTLKSVVFKPQRQRPRPRSPRPSPLHDLFKPDTKKYRKH